MLIIFVALRCAQGERSGEATVDTSGETTSKNSNSQVQGQWKERDDMDEREGLDRSELERTCLDGMREREG